MSTQQGQTNWLPTLLVGLALVAVNIGLVLVISSKVPSARSQDAELLRQVASKLASQGIQGEAARLYERHLETADIDAPSRARVGLMVAKLLKEEGKLEESLAWLYRVEAWDPKSEAAKEAAPLVVEVLERLGLSGAAQTALSSRSQLTAPPPEARDDSPVVATVGSRKLTLADLDEAMEALPESVRKQLSEGEGKVEFLKQRVAQELLYDKAVKRGLDKDPQVRRQLDLMSRQLIVSRMLEEEMQDKVKVDEGDVKNFFDANRERFKGADGKEPSFEEVKDRVLQAYVMEKAQSLSQELLRQAQEAQEVKLYPEALERKARQAPAVGGKQP